MRLALKVDVDTWRGTREGVPRLLEVLRRQGVRATFLFSLGPDHTGRALKRVFRRGFLAKVSRTSVIEHYGLRTLLYGTLLPGPDIGRGAADVLRSVRDAGHEVGIHCWDHVRWQDQVAARDAAWAEGEMRRAAGRFAEVFGEAARTHGAAGWQTSRGACECEKSLGMDYASDVRGTHAFRPVDDFGIEYGVPQLPTTLPTLDELIGIAGVDANNVHERLLGLTAGRERDEVYTLHAELEGLRLLPSFERLLVGWHRQGYERLACRDLFETLDRAKLPRCRIVDGEIAGRSGTLALQAV